MITRRPPLALAALVAASALVTGCTPAAESPAPTAPTSTRQITGPIGLPRPAGSTIERPGTVAPSRVNTGDVEGSLAPDDSTPEERIPEIVERGRIIVGIDQSLNLLSFRNPATGELEGFEVDLAHEIAADIFDDPDAVDFRFVDSGNRAEALESGEVDIIIRTMTVTEERQEQVEFSTPYLTSNMRMLSIRGSGINTYEDLEGDTVCVADNTTALEMTRRHAPESTILKTRRWSDCLLALQQHQADALIADDTILSGISAQDPQTQITGPVLTQENYGAAVREASPGNNSAGLVRQVNSTIERIRSDGTWWEMFDRWFSDHLAAFGPPRLNYRDEPEEATS